MAEILLEKRLFSPKHVESLLFGHSNHQLTLTMNRLFLIIAVAFSGITAGPIICAAEQYSEIPPALKCRYDAKNKTFCWRFPNFSFKHNICNPSSDCLGHIVWSKKAVTMTERDDQGNRRSYEAVAVTYRKVYENGAWGEKFRRTYRKEPTLITPPVLAEVSHK